MTKPNLADRQNINETKAHLQPYPAYKPSGVEWLGEIPKHWSAIRLKYIADVKMGQSPSSEECQYPRAGYTFLTKEMQSLVKFYGPTPKQYCPSANKYVNPLIYYYQFERQ